MSEEIKAQEFAKKHFPGIEKETWFPVIVALMTGYNGSLQICDIRSMNEETIDFFRELLENDKHMSFTLVWTDKHKGDICSSSFALKGIVDLFDSLHSENKRLKELLSKSLNFMYSAEEEFVLGRKQMDLKNELKDELYKNNKL